MTWRLVVTPAGNGAWNMALDEVLAKSTEHGMPFLRFYSWDPATLSLGKFQNPTWGLTPAAGSLPRVRRPTGGGAIWHDHELTYSLGCSADSLPAKGVKASFEILTRFLVETWRELGWEACWAKDLTDLQGPLGQVTAACFSGHEEYDVVVRGRKLGGNAQSRTRSLIFQHGSIPITLDFGVLSSIFTPDQTPHADRVTCLSEEGWTGTTEDLVQRLTDGFARSLGVEIVSIPISEEEQSEARALVQAKHANRDWLDAGNGSVRAPGPESPTNN